MDARQDRNRFPTLIGVSGTVGTADANGTADIVNISVDPATGAMHTKAIGASAADPTSGTINTIGTIGSISDVGKVHNAGTIAAGSLGNVAMLHAGTIDAVTSVANLVKGTLTKLEGGTLGEVTNLNSGTVRISVGTITTGSLTNIASLHTGTIQSVSEVVKGTTTLVSTVTTVSNLTTGSIVITSGTLGSVAAVAQIHNAGTIQAGTVQINARPVTTVLSHGTLGTAGGSFFATISAASGVGTNHFVSNVDIVMQSGTADVRVLAGTAIQGTGVIAAGKFPEGGGISKHFNPAFNAGANSELTYHFVGAGTAFITVNYWKGV